MSQRPLLKTTALLAAMLAAGPALAQSDESPAAKAPGSDAGGEPIIVTGRLFSRDSDPISAPVVLSGDTLTRQTRPQLGEMLAKLPGVSATSFAPGTSRPVLRGFDAARVRVLVDGIGSLDAATVSADHAVAVDTLTVERVEVLHGPEVLLYAGDPAGGAVNALDKRIPRRIPDNGYSIDALASYGSAADSVAGGTAIDVALAPRLVGHIDASWSRSSDLRIGGNVLSPQLRAETLAASDALRDDGDITGANELTAAANRRGRLANSATRSRNLGAGLAFIDEGGDLGVSVSRFTTTYGIPPRPEVGNPDPVSIALRQTRFDVRGGVNFGGGFLKRLEFRGAYGDYGHDERDAGIPEATFLSKGLEARLEAVQADQGGWRGRSGVQFGDRSLDVIGDERLIPNNHTSNLALFTLQQFRLGSIDLEAGGRYEKVDVRAKPAGPERNYNLWSGVVGAAWHPSDTLTFHVDFQHGERAPSAEELFIDGIHDATQSYERGNPGFLVERSNGIEGGVRFQSDGFLLSAIGFATDFENFITPIPTGEEIEGYPVFQFTQAKAKFRGAEVEASARLASWGDSKLSVDGGLDYTHAELTGIGPVPRIPPLRLRGGLEFGSPALTLRGEVEWNARQSRVTTFENETAPFTLIGASATWKPMGEEGPLTLILSGENLLDVDGRRAASQTRDFVPIAGRDIRVTAAISF